MQQEGNIYIMTGGGTNDFPIYQCWDAPGSALSPHLFAIIMDPLMCHVYVVRRLYSPN